MTLDQLLDAERGRTARLATDLDNGDTIYAVSDAALKSKLRENHRYAVRHVRPRTERPRYRGHIGLDFIASNGERWTCFQLIGDDNKAHAAIDWEGRIVAREMLTAALQPRLVAIMRLARIHRARSTPHRYAK